MILGLSSSMESSIISKCNEMKRTKFNWLNDDLKWLHKKCFLPFLSQMLMNVNKLELVKTEGAETCLALTLACVITASRKKMVDARVRMQYILSLGRV